MESNEIKTCPNCSKTLPLLGYFCGGCLTQFKCKSCDSFLQKEYLGCVVCGTPKETRKETNNNFEPSINTFRLHETSTDRTIEATFSDAVGKDLANILRDASANKVKAINFRGIHNDPFNVKDEQVIDDAADVEVLNNANDDSDGKSLHLPNNQGFKSSSSKNDEYPSLKSIAMKNLPRTEAEWVLVYAFYASQFGTSTFTRQDIFTKYAESNRLSEDKKKGLSIYLKRAVQAGYINPLTTDFSILDEGIKKAREIINRTSSSSPRIKENSKKKNEVKENSNPTEVTKAKKSTNGGKGLKRLTNINFEPSGKETLKDFFNKYSPKTDFERNLIFTSYLQNILEIKEITFDHIYSCYDLLELRVSENLPQTVRNTASRTGWIQITSGMVSVTIKGNNYIKAWKKK